MLDYVIVGILFACVGTVLLMMYFKKRADLEEARRRRKNRYRRPFRDCLFK